jgi:hypothetical protein
MWILFILLGCFAAAIIAKWSGFWPDPPAS